MFGKFTVSGHGMRVVAVMLLCLVMTCLMTGVSEAGKSNKDMPWESPLKTLADSFTGPVAQALSLIMIVIGVGVLMFGGNLQGWGRWVAFAVIAVGTIGGAVNFVKALGVDGALIF